MENGDEIKQNLIFLYTELQNPSLTNANDVSDTILDIYSSPSSIPILFDILENTKNKNFRLQASIGLKYSLLLCSTQLDQSAFNEIWENLFNIILDEDDEQNIDNLIPAIIEIFKISNYDWSFIAEFIDTLSQTDLRKCFQIASSILPFVNPNFVISQIDYFTNILTLSFQFPDQLTLFKYTFLLFYVLANDSIKNQLEIYDNLINTVSKTFSEILILILEDEKILQETISDIISSLEIRINPFSLELLFEPIIESLQNSTFSEQTKYFIILLFNSILSCDSSYEIDIETLQELIISSIPLSIEFFENSEDIEYPDSIIFSDFFYQCLIRIPIENLSDIVQVLFESFSNIDSHSELYNLLIFYKACLKRSDFLFIDEYPQIISVLIECLQNNHPGIRNEAAYVFCSQKVLIENIQKEQLFELISMIVDILDSQDFDDGFAVIKILIDYIDNSDPIFETTFSMCTQIIEENSETNSSLTEIGWKILNNLIKLSEKVVYEVADILYSNSFSMIESYIQNKEKEINFVPFAIKCLSSLSKSCKDIIIENFEELFPLLINLFESSDDLKISKSILKCIKTFVSKFPDEIENYILQFFKSTFLEFFVHKSINTLSELILQRDYSNDLMTPSINFLTKILEKYPHFFNNTEMFKYLFNIFELGINQIYEKEIIASLHLFKKIMIFMYKGNIILPNIVIPFISLIIEKMNKEISQKVICSMFDVINKGISIFGNSVIFQKEVHLFQFVLSCVDHNKNQFTNEIEYNHTYNNKALQLLSNIIRCFYDNEDNDFEEFNDALVNDFIPRIMQILDNYNPSFIDFGLNLLSQIAISTEELLSPEILEESIQKSLYNIENINGLTIASITFLDSLVYNYYQALDSLTPQLVELIETQISLFDCSIDDEKCLSEYFITLLTILDVYSDNLVDESKMRMILSYLPIVFSKSFNNKHIYSFLIRHFNDFQNLQFEILKNIVIVFESTETINNSKLPQEILSHLLAIIIQSDIPNNQNDLNILFDNQIDEIQSFLLTISFLTQHINDN